MKIFNSSLEWVEQDIRDGLYQLREYSNIEKQMDLYATLNTLSSAISFDKVEFNQKMEAIYRSSLSFRMARSRINSYQTKVFKNIDKNYMTNFYLPYHFLGSVEHYDKRKQPFSKVYFANEMYSILKDYYGSYSKEAEILDRLIEEKQIYWVPSPSGEDFHTSVVSSVLPCEAVFLTDFFSLASLSDLVFEISRIKEQSEMKDLKKMNQYRFCNDYKMVEATLAKKQFLEYLKREVSNSRDIEEIYQRDFHRFVQCLEKVENFMRDNRKKHPKDSLEIISFIQTMYGEIFSNILLTTEEDILLEFREYVHSKGKKLYEEYDLLGLGLTVQGASSKSVKEYQKNIGNISWKKV